MMKTFSGPEIRNIVLAGHNDTGKTTLASHLLFNAGAVNRLGRIEDGNTTTDFEPDEIERRHSLSAAVAFAEWRSHKINLIDTPGFGIFLAETRSAMLAADAAAIVISGVTGVEVSTEKVWRYANDFRLPRMVIVNKMDRERASMSRALDSLQRKFGKSVVPLQLPIGEERDFRGVIDLLTMKAWLYSPSDHSGKFEQGPIPEELQSSAKEWRDRLIEKVAENDEELMERFLEEGDLSNAEVIEGLRKEIRSLQIFPLFFASAAHNIAGQPLLDAIVDLMPNPLERGEIAGKNKQGEEVRFECRAEGFPSALVFKTLSDPFAGRVSILRVFTGTLKSDTAYFNTTRDHEERIGKLQLLCGKQQHPVQELRAGDIGAIAKLKDAHTGDTIASKEHPIILSGVESPESVISFAIEPKTKGDEDRIANALARIMEEDPSIRFHRQEQTKEFLLSGQGQLHIEVVVAKLKKKYGVDVILHPPKVPYRETITRASDAHGRHKKQSGGHGQFADCKIKIEPLPRGSEFEFVDEVFGGSVPRQYIPAVEKGIQEARLHGYLAGFPMVDFRVRLLDGQFHPVDSSEMAFKIAGALAFKDAMLHARPTILEPVMHVEVAAPTEYVGDLMGDLTSRRGKMDGIDSQEESQVIKARVPMSEMLTYGSTLRSITQGRGSFHMEFSHYDELPRSLQEKVIGEAKKPHDQAHH